MSPLSERRKYIRAGQQFTFRPVLTDRILTQHHSAVEGQRVRVIQLPSAPRPGTMGQCHIEDANTGEFLGMVCIASLSQSEDDAVPNKGQFAGE